MTPFIHIIMNLELLKSKYAAEYLKSRSNPKCVYYSKLSDKKYRDESKLFLAEGIKLTLEALDNAEVERIIVSVSAVLNNLNLEKCISTAANKNIPIILADDSVFDKISTEKAPQGIVAVVKYMSRLHVSNELIKWQENKRLLMLEKIRDPGNLGTIMRTAESMGINGIILANCTDLYNSKSVRAAMGTLFRMSIYISANAPECVEILKKCGRRVLAASLSDDSMILGKYQIDPRDCVIIGNEGHGISDEVLKLSDSSVIIPMAGESESLNASAAAACILWEYFRKNS